MILWYCVGLSHAKVEFRIVTSEFDFGLSELIVCVRCRVADTFRNNLAVASVLGANRKYLAPRAPQHEH